VQLPTGGESPRLAPMVRLIWWNSKADGYSPDGRRKHG